MSAPPPHPPIRQLQPEVAAKIAAGEVVERPASVVKELVENALDAGARHVRVELANGGLELIRVIDNGRGITAAELPLAFSRHATSKIGSLADLERISTLGFRGEALASIAAVARVTLISRPRAEAIGAQLSVDEGVASAVVPAGAAAGTSITVRDLFASVPARLKFLKTRATETGHALHLVEQYALAFPEVRFTVVSEGRQIFTTPGDGRLFGVLVAVYGLSVAEQMVPLDGEAEPSAADADQDDDASEDAGGSPLRAPTALPGSGDRPRVSGYVSRPSCYKATRHYLSFFVNRRWVQSRTLSYAVEEAYHSLLLAGRHPLAVIDIRLDPALLDANVHPAKTEIKFLHERQVFAAVQRAVRAAVLATAETPSVSAQAFSRPTFATAAPISVWGADASTDASAPDDAALAQTDLWRATAGQAYRPSAAGAPRDATGFTAPGTPGNAPVGGTKLPILRVLGQVSQSYIITEGPDGMYLVDQHAAHERILLERMIAEWRARAVSSQLLLQPLPLELSAAEREAIEEHQEALAAIGFALEPFGGDALLVRAVPAALANLPSAQPLRELLLGLAGADADAVHHGETWEEHALANVACKAAIKAGQMLSPQEQRELISQLEGVDAHQSCCHGRPTMVHLSLSALERQFERR